MRRIFKDLLIAILLTPIVIFGWYLYSESRCSPYSSYADYRLLQNDSYEQSFFYDLGEFLESDGWRVYYATFDDNQTIYRLDADKKIEGEEAFLVLRRFMPRIITEDDLPPINVEEYPANMITFELSINIGVESSEENWWVFNDIVNKLNERFDLQLTKSKYHYDRQCSY